MTREEQILNGFAEMMKGFWNNQDLEVPNLETPCKQDPCDNTTSKQATINAIFREPFYESSMKERGAEEVVPAQSEPEELDFVQPHKKIGVKLEIGQLKRSKGENNDIR